jgi:hypothetical protein
MVVHKIKFEGKVYIGKPGKDGKTVFDPPLPPEYEQQVKDRFSEVLRDRVFPGLNTDTTFAAGRGTLDKQFDDPKDLEEAVAAARAQGYNPKPTDIYCASVADKVGDREAWIPGGADAKGHIRRVCEKRNIGCSGSLNIPQPEPRVDPDIARKKARERVLMKQAKKLQAMQQRQKAMVPKQ